MGKQQNFTSKQKKEITERYLNGESINELVIEYGINRKKLIYNWAREYQSGNTEFENKRGKASGPKMGRPRAIKPIEEMTKDEYIAYLEMKLDIAKAFAEIDKRNMK